MGVLKPSKPLNNISLEVDGSNLHLCGVDNLVEPKIALRAQDPPDQVSFPSREVNLHASEVSPCYDFLGFDNRPMLNSAKRDRIFYSIRFLKASSFASIASSDATVYTSRSIILRSFFCCRVSGMGILEKGVAGWKVNRFGWK
ncbi:hypothetical protein GW17_00061523 [Ensete ventricosum]|nr:hypothetical protein GW17_00061523 [Ensete ventricosum]